jgi:hypothetical protein
MPEVNEYTPGSFCWIELGTNDAAAAKRFYSELFGWGFSDTPVGPDMVYTILQIDGKEVGALYQQDERQRTEGVPPNWLSYVSVRSADETTAKAKSLGATIVMEPFDVFDVGRMAVMRDPQGATFAVWQPRAHIGAVLVGEVGTCGWNELATTDPSKARDFYTSLFGWGTKVSGPPMAYTEWLIGGEGGQSGGGMLEINPEWGNVPPHWMPYFMVADCDASVDKARSLGGEIRVPPTDIEKVGRFAVIQDPQGAVFAIIKLTHTA